MPNSTRTDATRRKLLLAGLYGSAITSFPSFAAKTAEFPTRPIQMTVPFPPGGGTDTLARLLADQLASHLGQSVIVENKGGAGGIIGSKDVARATPDGYTILLNATGQIINPVLHRSAPYDLFKDFSSICYLCYVPQLVLVNADFPGNTFQEFLQIARRDPTKVIWATSGFGTAGHLAEELINSSAGIPLKVAPYRGGGPALSDLIGGHVQAMVEPLPSSIPHVQSGRLKALAVTSPIRSKVLPDVPTVAESGIPKFSLPSWYGIWGPSGIPAPVATKLYEAFKAVLNTPKTRDRLESLSYVVVAGSPSELEGFARSESEKFAAIIKKANIMID